MAEKYILALDQGTTGSRAVVFSDKGKVISSASRALPQYYPKPGWVEHNPGEILQTQIRTAEEAVLAAGVKIECVGITNQRETTVIWDKSTGKQVYNALVWQCRRTTEYCEGVLAKGYGETIKQKTGLGVDPYFSASKIKWILDHIPDGIPRAKNGELAFGTVDSWLVYNLSGGKSYATDPTNASRTLLFNINTLDWDNDLCDIFGIPKEILPPVKNTAGLFGYIDAAASGLPACLDNIPITGVAGDQQASLFGQTCFEVGSVKNTYGTGCFTLMNTGEKPVAQSGGLISTVAWCLDGKPTYALEGSVFNAGSAITFLKDNLGIIKTPSECDRLAETAADGSGVFFVPAFTGLGSPYWDPRARGVITGLTRGSTKAHICRAALEGIAFGVCDLISAMESLSGRKITSLRCDGGASVSDFLLSFQADMLGAEVDRPEVIETTSLGAAFFAGIGHGMWENKESLLHLRKTASLFKPKIEPAERLEKLAGWHDAVRRSRGI